MVRPQIRLVPASPPEATQHEPMDFATIFRRYTPYVAQVATRILGRNDDIEDLVQEVFSEAHRGLDTLREPRAIRRWLATITVRRATRRLRRRRILHYVGMEPPIDTSTIVEAGTSPEIRAQLAAVYRVLDTISPEARIAWIMRTVEDEPLETVADVCGCSRATAHRRLQEAQAALSKAFRDG
jgi:RNA polymerase sigma-70 factor (ECF subfamily)